MIKRCQTCGKPYIKNKNLPEDASEFLQKVLGWIPNCKCMYNEKQKETFPEIARIKVQNIIDKYKKISIIDNKFKASRFDVADMKASYMQLAQKFANTLLTKKGKNGIYFFGNVGTGKTYVTSCIANALMDGGLTVIATNITNYIRRIKSTDWDRTEDELLKLIKQADLVIIDDFGTEYVKHKDAFIMEKVFNLIDTRYRAEKPLVVSSNLNLTELSNLYGTRISDRIKEMCMLFEVTGESRRESPNEGFINWISN